MTTLAKKTTTTTGDVPKEAISLPLNESTGNPSLDLVNTHLSQATNVAAQLDDNIKKVQGQLDQLRTNRIAIEGQLQGYAELKKKIEALPKTT